MRAGRVLVTQRVRAAVGVDLRLRGPAEEEGDESHGRGPEQEGEPLKLAKSTG
jgi:hypothetical protein